MASKRQLRSYLVILGGFLIYMTLGAVYTFGNLTTYMTSYIRSRSHPESLTYGQSAWVLTVSFSSLGLFMTMGGYISLKIGPRWSTLLGCGISSLGVCLTYFTISWTFYACLFTYSFMNGLGGAIAYTSPISCAMKWHPDNKGLVNGIMMAGLGIGAFIFDQVQSYFINPDNRVPDLPAFPGSVDRYFSEAEASDILDRVPQCFLLLGGICIVLQLIGCLMLAYPPTSSKESMMLISRAGNNNQGSDTEKDMESKDNDVPPKEVLRSKSFYMVWFMLLFSGQAVLLISSLYKAFGQTFIRDDHFLTMIGSLASLCDSSGRSIWGMLVDKTSFRTCIVALSTLMCVMVLLLNVSAIIQSRAMYAVWVCLLFIIFSGNFVLFPTVASKAFGPKYLCVNMGLIYSSEVLAGIIAAVLSSTIVDSLGWFWIFSMIAGFSFITAILGLIFDLRDKFGNYI